MFTKFNLVTLAATAAVILMTGGAFAKTFEAAYSVNIHSHASKKSSVLDKLYEGERVTVKTCDDNEWCFITHAGPDGWVPVAALERVRFNDDGPTIIVQGGFDFGHHPKKPPVIVDPGPHKPPFGQVTNVGNLPVSVFDPVTGGGNGGGVVPPHSPGNGGTVICHINKPCLHPL
ncbi:MAG: SH3 domain-containing protein [Devosia sp.]